jgi:thiol-disulfide isomerase/thioredoxin
MRMQILVWAIVSVLALSRGQEKSSLPEQPAKEKPTPQQLLLKARDELRRQEYAAAIQSVEELLKENPKHREGLAFLAQTTRVYGKRVAQGSDQETDLVLKSAKCAKQLRAAYPDLNGSEKRLLADVLYDEACIEARTGNSDKALAALDGSVNSGFKNVTNIGRDTDLDSLRKLPRFQQLVKIVSARAAAHAGEQAKMMLAKFKSFPFEFSLSNLDGKTVTLKDYAGRITIVHIWGTWCPPCRADIPHLADLHKKYKRLEIVGVNCTNTGEGEAAQTVRDFVKNNKVPYPCLIGTKELLKQVPNLQGFPTTLFLDCSGKVRLMLLGAQSLETLEAVVKTLLAESEPMVAR